MRFTGATLTGLRMKNIVMAPTSGMSPISGSRITRSFPWSYKQKMEYCTNSPDITQPRPLTMTINYVLIPGLLSLRLCKSTF